MSVCSSSIFMNKNNLLNFNLI